jgi:carbonic anhydrase
MVFDQGLGDLFVVRVAGNIVVPSVIGSVELAAERFGTRLVVVVGHSRCGAVLATLEALARPSDTRSTSLQPILDQIQASLKGLPGTGSRAISKEVVAEAVRANVRASANHLRNGSELLKKLTREAGLLIVGAEYSLESGVVDFFDGVPPVR